MIVDFQKNNISAFKITSNSYIGSHFLFLQEQIKGIIIIIATAIPSTTLDVCGNTTLGFNNNSHSTNIIGSQTITTNKAPWAAADAQAR